MASSRKVTKTRRKARDQKIAKRRQAKTKARERKQKESGALILS